MLTPKLYFIKFSGCDRVICVNVISDNLDDAIVVAKEHPDVINSGLTMDAAMEITKKRLNISPNFINKIKVSC